MDSKGFFLTEIPSAHIRLFRREFIESTKTEDFNYLQRFISRKQQKQLIALIAAHEFEYTKHLLFQSVAYSSEHGALDALRKLITRDASEEVKTQLELHGLRTHIYYAKFFLSGEAYKMDRLAVALEPEPIVDYLRGVNTREYETLINRVDTLIKQKLLDEATCELLRGLPYCSDHYGSERQLGDWYYDFLEACLSSGYTKMIPRFIDPDYSHDITNRKAKKELEYKKQINSFNLNNAQQLIMDTTYVPTQPRDQKDYERYRKTSFGDNFELERRYYTLYPYQNELVAAACSGKNTIICAPTGSGKTIVATEIVLNHVQNFRRENKVARAIMLVPTIPLVEQQTLHFIQYTYGICWVDGISGAESVENRAENVLATDLCVMTPQILINMLNSILKTERLYFLDFTLLIFDECHHVASGAHPYKVLMEMLEESKVRQKPQIVGLTASIGVGSSLWDLNLCRKHMLNLCLYMNVDTISTVRKQLDNLRAYVVPPADAVERVSRSSNDLFAIRIKEAMWEIQESMTPYLEKILQDQLAPIKRDDIIFPEHHYPSRYQTVVAGMRRNLQKLTDKELKLVMTRSINHLSHYFHALGLSDLLPNKYGYNYLHAKMSSYTSPTLIDLKLLEIYKRIRGNLYELAANENLQGKNILKKLYEIIAEQYSLKTESRTLIFVTTRVCAQYISEHLSEYLSSRDDLVAFRGRKNCVGYMTSSNQSASFGGQSAELQRLMRSRFERGDIKILAVTSVADEGINIMSCNLVIKYNNVGSERTLIQRRGRARARDSRSILLALDNAIEMQEYENVCKEMMMHRCIEDLQSRSEEALKKMISNRAEEIKKLREISRQQINERRERLKTQKYLLKCRACSKKICESMDVRKLGESLYSVCDSTIWTRSSFEIVKKPSKDGLITTCARWICSCSEEWGSVIRYAGAFLPRLDVRAFLLERLDTRDMFESRANFRWRLIEEQFFNIEPITPLNIRLMVQALTNQMDGERQKRLEEQEELAKQLLIEKMKKRPDKKVKVREYFEE